MEPFEEQLGRSMHSESVGLLHRQCSNPADHGTIRTLWFLPSAIEDVPDSTKVLLKLRNPSDSRESPTLGPASGRRFQLRLDEIQILRVVVGEELRAFRQVGTASQFAASVISPNSYMHCPRRSRRYGLPTGSP